MFNLFKIWSLIVLIKIKINEYNRDRRSIKKIALMG